MVSADYIRTLFDYNAWATDRLLSATVGAAHDDLVRELLPGLPPVLSALTHCLGAELIWRQRWEGQSPTALLSPAEVPTLTDLTERWRAETTALHERLSALTEGDLGADLHYTDTRGRQHSTPLWAVLVHLANHGTQHRSEVAAMLTALGRSPGDLDMILYFRTRAA